MNIYIQMTCATEHAKEPTSEGAREGEGGREAECTQTLINLLINSFASACVVEAFGPSRSAGPLYPTNCSHNTPAVPDKTFNLR